MISILIIHGPNLNLLGQRQPEIYGTQGFESVISELKLQFPNTHISYFQSNIEGELIDTIQQCQADGIIINAGGYAHTSVAIADAVAAIKTPCIQVHISNVYQREVERHVDLLSKYCIGGIYGFQTKGYQYAMDYLIEYIRKLPIKN